jgi:hypothetical protein
MKSIRSLLVVLFTIGAVGCGFWKSDPEPPPAPLPDAPPRSGPQLVLRVDSAEILVLESYPPQFRLRARGKVSTAGWTSAQLRQRRMVRPPPDGLFDFDFIASPPTDAAAQAVTPIEATTWLSLPPTARGVRVHSLTTVTTAFMP